MKVDTAQIMIAIAAIWGAVLSTCTVSDPFGPKQKYF